MVSSVMEKFFFDVDVGIMRTCDNIGQRFANRNAASEEATGILAEIARDLSMRGVHHDLTVAMRDKTGLVVYTATLCIKASWANSNAELARPAAPVDRATATPSKRQLASAHLQG